MDKTWARFCFLIAVAGLLFAAPLLHPSSMTGNYGDIYMHYYPLKHLVAEHLVTGRMPLWNPYIYTGQPLLANPQAAVFYPFTMFFYFLPLPFAFTLFMALHVALAGICMFLFLRAGRRSSPAALFCAFAFMLSSFVVFKIVAGHPVALSGYIWLPLIMLCLDRMARSPRHVWPVLLGCAAALQLLSGHAFPIYVSAMYLLFHVVAGRLSYVPRLLVAAEAFFAVSAVQLLPTMELSGAVEKGNWPLLVERYSLPLKNLVTIIIPGFFGSVLKGNFVEGNIPSYFLEKYGLYFGIIPAALALCGFVMAIREKKWRYPLLVVFGLFIATGFYNPVYRFLYGVLPGLDALRVPARFYLLSLVAFITLAAFAWERFIAPRRRIVKGLLLGVLMADLLWMGLPYVTAQDATAYRSGSLKSLSVSPLYRMATEPDQIASNKSMLYHHYNANGYEAIILQDYTRFIGLQEHQALNATGLAKTDLFTPMGRGLSIGYLMAVSPRADLEEITGLPAPLHLYRVAGALPRIFWPASLLVLPEKYDQMNYLRTTTLMPAQEIIVKAKPAYLPETLLPGTIKNIVFSTERIDVEAKIENATALAFTDVCYGGWQAYGAGKKIIIERGNRVFRTLFLEAGDYVGDNRIVLLFRPFSLYLGVLVTIAGMLLLAGFAVRNLITGDER